MKNKLQKLLLSFTIFLFLTYSFSAFSQISIDGRTDYGRLFDVTYHPTIENTLYAHTFFNHIVKSEDNGENWEIIYSYPESGAQIRNLRFLGTSSLSFMMNRTNDFLDNEIVIFDLTTNTVSEEITPPDPGAADEKFVETYDIFQNDPEVMLISIGYRIGLAQFSKVYYTANGGNDWIEVYYNVDHDSVFPKQIAISPIDSKRLFITRGNGPTDVDGGLFISNNVGVTWEEKLEGVILETIAFNPSNANEILVGTGISFADDEEKVYQSSDGGGSWNDLPIVWTDFLSNNITHIEYDPNDPDRIIILEENEIAISNDGGSTWNNYTYPFDGATYSIGNNLSFNPFNSNEVIINSINHPERSIDGGVTLTRLENPFFSATNLGISTTNNPSLYYGLQNGIVYRDLGTMIESAYGIQDLNFGGSNTLFVEPNIEGRVYMLGGGGFGGLDLAVSNDNGENTSIIHSIPFGQLVDIATNPLNTNEIWISTTDGGTSKIDFSNISIPEITSVTLPSTDLHTATLLSSSDPNNIFITQGAFVYETTDGGTTWIQKSNGITLNSISDFIFDIKRNPNQTSEMVIGTSQGIFKTTDNAETWVQVHSGDIVRSIKYNQGDGRLGASVPTSSSSDAKILYSLDNADTWTTITYENFERAQVNEIDYLFEDNSIIAYLATSDLGVVTYEVDTSVLSIQDPIFNKENIYVYPNPANNQVSIHIPEEDENYSVSIFSINGQKVMETNTIKNIDTSRLSSGVYLLKVKKGKISWTKKLIKI